MKIFIKNSLIFLLIFLVSICLTEFISSKIVSHNSNFKIQDHPKFVVLGHSHSECAFNDSIIIDLSNFSKSGESYFYIYQKAKKLFEQNPEINTAFIEFTNNSVDESMNEFTWGNKYMSQKFTLFSAFMSSEEKIVLMRKNCKSFLNAFSVSLKNRIAQILKRKFNYIDRMGGYLHLIRNNVPENIDSSKSIPYLNNKISEFNIGYLIKIIELCRKYQIGVVLVRSPLHESYSGYQNESIFQLVLQNQLKSIEFLDFSKFPLRDTEFGDLEHLNYKGAKVFSTWFQQILNQGLLEMSNKQNFINNEIGKIKAKDKK
ncbi:MAG: hypothetical protein KAS62_00040 [Candidatus Delongbacteria bacterium]|nr:hypothetical protein [Candidatus Delongbacteria bacterium]